MVDIKFNFDEDGFKRAIEQQVNQGMREIGSRAQRELDTVFSQHQGERAEDIVPHIEVAMRRVEWKLPPDHLRAYAEAMAEGRRVVIQTENVSL